MRTAVALFAALSLPAIFFGQTTNNQSISGTVQDASGAVVPNATVTVVSEGTNLRAPPFQAKAALTSFRTCRSGFTIFLLQPRASRNSRSPTTKSR